jgi:hypothetical protein
MSKNSDKSSNSERSSWVKAVNNRRNLAFLLLDLSEFVIRQDICFELGFLLLKQALLILKTAIQYWINKGFETTEGTILTAILKKEFIQLK